jgi:adenylate cyclase
MRTDGRAHRISPLARRPSSPIRPAGIIARHSQPVNVQKVSKELGIQYIAEGSVRKAGNRVRITVQLIEAETDRHLWAERYNRELEDIFDMQDEVTTSIAAIYATGGSRGARAGEAETHTDNLAAWELVLAGKLLHHRSNPEA